MSLHDDLNHVQRTLDDLVRSVNRLSGELGDSLDLRRVRSDAAHLRESLALLRESSTDPSAPKPPPEPGMVTIPDAPYDPTLWGPGEDEGLGSPHGHAP
ncbi:hypothetical protein [Wenjunlia tyrosinilytica]|jgi:hypothetical protein|uniref:Uncharacterized protein n=1 Tax=Wenjunlia tyrosinilytica TaxID=1544741 RepID=A0A917ZVL1_9ACTN|nr:hypothetical protein [Wenjunlia tyrosinilytica]GGO97723.1 hypothetical protein GCM10012280_60210 [Wenjunlia tyrosinilytica]